ncbi:MAG: YwbE family protein [Polaribacter sp.]|uniref:YwbE family protein n=1 Tax=Polaribacter sp. TaxID=1920175 RepID=UPI002F35B5AE
MIDGRQQKNVQIGLFVEIIQKPHQRTGELTEGIVAKILTKSTNHPYGIKVQLESGLVGRIKNIITEQEF